MGRKRVVKAVNAEAHHYTHVMMDGIKARWAATHEVVPVETVISAAFMDGLEIGTRVGVGDVTQARALIELLETDLPVNGERLSVPAADRLLKALSKP